MSYKSPLTPLIDDPVNIDRPIQEMQQVFATLSWLDRSFGRAYESRSNHPTTNKVRVYPQVWQGLGLDLLNVLPNDNLKSQSFFKVEEPIECIRFLANGYSQMRARVSVIFWFNLQRIDPTIDYSYGEVLKGQVQRLLTNMTFSPYFSVRILRVWETVKQVYAGYTLDEVRDQELIHPYGGFRFECELTFQESCPDEVYTPPPLPSGGGGGQCTWDTASTPWNG